MTTILSSSYSDWSVWAMLLLLTVGVLLCYLFYIKIPRDMAHRRHRDATPWVLLGFFITPFWVMIILLFLGDKRPDPYDDEI